MRDDDLTRASRYVVIAPDWLRLQSAQSVVNVLGVISIAASSLLGVTDALGEAAGWIGGALITLLLASIAFTIVMRRRQLRRIAAFAAAHPLLA